MCASLEKIARFVSGGEAEALTLVWRALRYQHTTLIRSTLAKVYKPATDSATSSKAVQES